MFLMQHDLTVWSMPLDETSTRWNKVLLTEGMRIVQIGPEDSKENQNLQKGVALHPVELLGRCLGEYRGHVDLVLHQTQDLVPMFEEDCQGLQEACAAEGFGPENNGYWPPYRLLDHSYEKTICVYRSLKLPGWLGKVWTVLEQGEQGLTCRGEPRKRLHFDHVNNLIVTTRVETCKDACSKEPWCSHVFYKGEVPEAFRTDFDFIPPDMKQTLRVHNATRSTAYECLLYETCPLANSSEIEERTGFVPVTCGQDCGEDHQRCMMVRQGFERREADRFLGGKEGCRKACEEALQDVAQCNAFVYSIQNGGTCTLYGPDPFIRPFEGWKTLPVNYVGAVGSKLDLNCFLRSTDPFHQGRIRNRQFANSPGILLRFTDKTTCGGCLERTLFEWLREPSAFCMVLSHLITLFGACYVARHAHASVQLGKAAFSGKPVVYMTIVQDPANSDNFEIREAAYRKFLSKCCEVAEACRREDEATHENHEVDCWEDSDASRIVPTNAENYETYELSNKRRTKCYIDKDLLGIQPGEKVRTAWSDTPRHGIYKMLFGLLFYYLILFLISWVAPENFKTFWTALGFRPLFLIIIPGMVVTHHYVEIRREVQSLCVLTSWGRLVHLTRRPPPDMFPAILCPAWYGGTSVQLDSFKLGRISLAQLDMPAKPLLEDRWRSGFSEAWRRGAVTLRGSRGLLQIRRTSPWVGMAAIGNEGKFFSSGIGKSRPLLSAIAMASLAPEVEFEVVLKNTFMEVRVREDVGQQPRRASWSCGQRLMADATLVLSTDSVKNEQQMQQDCEPETDDKVKIQQHAEGTCKPCVFFASTAGCRRPKCPYCHLSHVHKSTPRPRKSNREIFKQAVDKVFQQEQDLASLHASLQDLASQERYLRLLVIGQIESRFSDRNPGLQ
eukprot:symbB.v1.2.010968.t1/scaffold727.1/size198231/13